MSKEVIAVDIDEVLFPFVEHFVHFDNAERGGNLRPSDFHCYAFEQIMDIPLEEAVGRVYRFNESDHDHIKPLDEAETALETLARSYELVAVTARHPRFEQHTSAWLDTHFPGRLSQVTYIGYAAVMEKPKKKVEVCHELGAVALIDDSVEHIMECSEQRVEGILFGNYPWNQADELPVNITRCDDWPAVLEYFDARG